VLAGDLPTVLLYKKSLIDGAVIESETPISHRERWGFLYYGKVFFNQLWNCK
jgi:hypothetical protein